MAKLTISILKYSNTKCPNHNRCNRKKQYLSYKLVFKDEEKKELSQKYSAKNLLQFTTTVDCFMENDTYQKLPGPNKSIQNRQLQ